MSHRALEVGFDVPAEEGMAEAEIETPCLVLDLDALEHNIRKLGDYVRDRGIRLRTHAKMHKSVDVARMQLDFGGASGICCQKVSEAEVFIRAGITDVLISNQVRGPSKIDRLARLPLWDAEVHVCIDDPENVAEISEAAERHGTSIGGLVEIDCGAGRCGVTAPGDVVALARAIDAAPGLTFEGVQAYQGSMQHIEDPDARLAAFDAARAVVEPAVAALREAGLAPKTVTGAGTGSFEMEAGSNLWNELQCGSYAFMDADYGRIRDADGRRLDQVWRNALFILTSVMSTAKPGQAVCDAGLKVQSVDSGLPLIFGREDVRYAGCSDEHGTIDDPGNLLKVGDRLKLVPGHCDPTCNIHDWYVGLRDGEVECVWPVSARGKAY